MESKNNYIISKTIFNGMCLIMGTILMIFFMHTMQHQAAIATQRTESEQVLTQVVQTIDKNITDAEELTAIYHNGNRQTLNDLKSLLTSGIYSSISTVDNDTRAKIFAEIQERSGTEYLYLMDRDGTILLAPRADYLGFNLLDHSMLSAENLKKLVDTPDGTPVFESNDTGSYFFYSTMVPAGKKDYYLVLGVNSSILGVQFDSLTDISNVIKGITVNEDGFVFAVNKEENTFIYYDDGNEDLTGLSAAKYGVTEKMLRDRYMGTATINGRTYYCVTRQYGDYIIVSAAVRTETVYANTDKTLIWSTVAFILITLICMVYSLIIRNDMIAKETEADVRVLGRFFGTDILVNRTVFQRILPVCVIGAVVVFGISYYSQTILELSNGVAVSEQTIEDLGRRYQLANDNGEFIEDYYDKHYLGKARLLAFLLEENPSALNTGEKKLYMEFDETGHRYNVLDDEGNNLYGIRYSDALQKLCKENDLESIWIYNTEGHVIATSTEGWYFTLGLSEEDQSYPFRQILEGKKDYYVQEATQNDLGYFGQYIGTLFRYYTYSDEQGNTIYASRFDYENYLNGKWKGPDIHVHESLLQIGLRNDLMTKLKESVSPDYLFKNTKVMGSGFLMAFDNTDEHRVLYSFNKSSIGKTAEEIGMLANSFSGDYNGFANINGVRYFQSIRFLDGYYVASVIPLASMYANRLKIAMITAGTSFVFILLMVALVSFTTRKEEELYLELARQIKQGEELELFKLLENGRKRASMASNYSWNKEHVPWHKKSPEQKLWIMVRCAMIVFVVYILTIILGAKAYFGESSIIFYILSGQWERSFNIFAFSACTAVVVGAVLIIFVVNTLIGLATSVLGEKSETLGHLLCSVMKYGCSILALFYCLFLLGVDSRSLITSGAILSLVVGLGSQSLIADIISGIFIVFEGVFRVGDYVKIGDFRGQVLDIGLRTTKIMSQTDNNIKIINNGSISGVVNLTKEESLVVCKLLVGYSENLIEIERILNEEMKTMKEKIPAILYTPVIRGISELEDSGYQIRIDVHCYEAYVPDTTFRMNRELMLICERHGIEIPYQTVTLSKDHHDIEEMSGMIIEGQKK